MNINPLLLSKRGIKIDYDVDALTPDEERIIETLYSVDLENYNSLLRASEELRDIDPSIVVNCIAAHWNIDSVLDGMQNIEKVFRTKVKLNNLIKRYFEDSRHWHFYKYNSDWLDQFNDRSNASITVDDIARNVDIDFIINSRACGPGIDGFFSFVIENGGDPYIVIRKIAARIDCLSNIDVEDIVFWITPYLEPGDIDMEKLFSRIDWDTVKRSNYMDIYEDFFKRLAPELVSKIPS